jgi:hypothetical protein
MAAALLLDAPGAVVPAAIGETAAPLLGEPTPTGAEASLAETAGGTLLGAELILVSAPPAHHPVVTAPISVPLVAPPVMPVKDDMLTASGQVIDSSAEAPVGPPAPTAASAEAPVPVATSAAPVLGQAPAVEAAPVTDAVIHSDAVSSADPETTPAAQPQPASPPAGGATPAQVLAAAAALEGAGKPAKAARTDTPAQAPETSGDQPETAAPRAVQALAATPAPERARGAEQSARATPHPLAQALAAAQAQLRA